MNEYSWNNRFIYLFIYYNVFSSSLNYLLLLYFSIRHMSSWTMAYPATFIRDYSSQYKNKTRNKNKKISHFNHH